MILERFDSVALLGVEVNRNMECDVVIAAMNIGLSNKPELASQFSAIMSALSIVSVLGTVIYSNLETILTHKQNLVTAKRTLEIAVKAYQISSTAAMILIDVKPSVNGVAPGTGSSAVLTPLKIAVENATTVLQDLEDLIQAGMTELNTLTAEYKEQLNVAVDNLIKKIAELGNQNIVV